MMNESEMARYLLSQFTDLTLRQALEAARKIIKSRASTAEKDKPE